MMRRILAVCFASIVGSLSLAAPCRAQEAGDPPRSAFWLNAGLGVCSLGSLGGSASASFQWGKNVLTVRGTENSEGLWGDELWDVGLLYGRAVQTDHFFLSGGVGIAAVGGSRDDGTWRTDEKIDTTIGVPLEVQAFWRPFGNVLGLGIYGYGDLNPEETFFGAAFCLHLGKFR